MGVMMVIVASVFSLLNPLLRHLPGAAGSLRHAAAPARGGRRGPEGPGHGGRGHVLGHTWWARSTPIFSPLLPHASARSPRIRPARSARTRSVRRRVRRRSRSCTSPRRPRRRRSGTTCRAASAELKVDAQPGCPSGDDLCGFDEGMRVLIMNLDGDYDIFTITHVQSSALHLQHRDDKFTTAYPAGSIITQIVSHTYYLQDNGTEHVSAAALRRLPDGSSAGGQRGGLPCRVLRRPAAAAGAEAGNRSGGPLDDVWPETSGARRGQREGHVGRR